jgi:hypothetical protein
LKLSAMALSCGAKCAKLLLIIFNAIFWVKKEEINKNSIELILNIL